MSPQAVDQAVDWLVLFLSGSMDEHSRAAWQRWRDADPEHARVWHRVETMENRLRTGMAGTDASAAIAAVTAVSHGRRRALKSLSILLGAGAAVWFAGGAWQGRADFRTDVGERRSFRLAEGTRLDLNTGSAVRVHYGDGERVVQLLQGEVLIATELDTAVPARPFVVETAAGRARALGTRFVVRQMDDVTRVAVLEHAVEFRPADNPALALRLEAGQVASFDRREMLKLASASAEEASWADGFLHASDMRLDAFIAELARYRPGRIVCAPECAGLRLSGMFPLGNTDLILQALTEVLPVDVQMLTRYWVTVLPHQELPRKNNRG
ncbi:sensor [Oxalicibacterium flavum]|uniref:Sensor n=1 Tax=Oxalicibacterium flavum TaxID=179467 RepID=A0A8J2UNF0_9BURK|nr:FecR domain-containing protein [Oxalicibacterium flavum]GGC12803.1 sensor [Oxalicibacterium flavum]